MSQEKPQREKPGPAIRMFQLLGLILTPLLIRLYRLLDGRLVGGLGVHLTTVGRRSGQPRTVIVGYLRDGEDVVVAGSNLAKPAVPAWVLNLRAQRQRFGSAGTGTKHGQRSSKEKIGRHNGTGWWLPTHSTTRCSESPAESSLSSGCGGLRGHPSSHPRTPKASAWRETRTERIERSVQSGISQMQAS